mmetsp:Transcript_17511/g.31682  ORF Transcript_17511/g.31682 Transcript_17511/m.31682 type:complete len:80 (+) Transcript_17511:1088-1327(+)
MVDSFEQHPPPSPPPAPVQYDVEIGRVVSYGSGRRGIIGVCHIVAGLYFHLLMLIIFDLLFSSFKMGLERPLLVTLLAI